jgi:hypothetical protein
MLSIVVSIAIKFPDDGPRRDELLALDVDVRIYALLLDAWKVMEWSEAAVAAFLRMAYAAGYYDALGEARRAQLCRDHGLIIPRRGSR